MDHEGIQEPIRMMNKMLMGVNKVNDVEMVCAMIAIPAMQNKLMLHVMR
jgi:hypothetical protein